MSIRLQKMIFLSTLSIHTILFSRLFAKETLLVVNFEAKTRYSSVEKNAVWLPAQIQDALVRSPYVGIVERKKLEEVLKEMKLGQTGLLDQATVMQAGKLLGAKRLLLGEIDSQTGLKLNISVRLIDAESGTVERQWTATDKKEKALEPFIRTVAGDIERFYREREALIRISNVTNDKPAFHVHLTAEKPEYAFGEMLSIQMTADTGCYVYLFDVGTSGKIHLLFPNRTEPDNRIRAGVPVYVGNLKTGPPAGVEMLKAVAALDSISLQDLLDKASASALLQTVGGNIETFSRDLELLVSPLPVNRWSEFSLKINIREK